jgi:ferric-dicitrate binding protein FerR (iron transport regulator)
MAAVVLIGAVGVIWWLRPVERSAPLGTRLVVTLPDGSRAELNSGSSLRYGRWIGTDRFVRLVGQAYFDVRPEERPFVVETFNARIRVLGTRFSVRSWPDGLEPGTTVTLESGRVALAPSAQPELEVSMTGGETRRIETASSYDAPRLIHGVTVDEATAWRRGDLVFKDQLLGLILEDVERRFAVDIQLRPVMLRQKRLSLALRQPAGPRAVVHDIAVTLGLQYRETSNGFALYTPSL